MENLNEKRFEKIESKILGTQNLFKIVFERLDTLDEQITPKLSENRKKIGLKANTKN